jgi:hypothetical protein
VYQSSLLSRTDADVKAHLLATFGQSVDRLLALAKSDASVRVLEEAVWDESLGAMKTTMSVALGLKCRVATEEDIRDRGLKDEDVRLRRDEESWLTMMTTFGPVTFFNFAYRDLSIKAIGVTRTPARARVYPLHQKCRSTELCLEWEIRLGSDLPFRRAEESLTFFTHGSVTLEDTTIRSHLIAVSTLLSREWLYRTPEEIREILRYQASRDLETGKPIIYLSTDAHALRRFVDDTWTAAWKMANGMRLWCVDRKSGSVIHLGGEFTWGDCHRVGEIVDWLIKTGRLTQDGDYGDGLVASVSIVTDGMEWIEEYVVAKFTVAVAILDAYHALDHLKKYVDSRYGKKSAAATEHYDEYVQLLLGKRPEKGTKKRKLSENERREMSRKQSEQNQSNPVQGAENASPSRPGVDELIERLKAEAVLANSIKPEPEPGQKEEKTELEKLIDYLIHNRYRMNYLEYRRRGYQIGSGAMESLHRNGSQIRLKIPGPGWLEEPSRAIFDLRMLYLCGRWDEFWHQPDFLNQLVEKFKARPGELAGAVAKAA